MTEASPEPLVLRTDTDGVAVVQLNRPARKNAIIGPMLDELATVVDAVSADESVAAMVLCGSGGAFCSGLDLKEYRADPPPPWLADAGTALRRAHVALAGCPVPVVVALERYAINGGAALALAGDLIVVGQESWLQVGEVRIGMAAPNNLAWLLARHPLATVLRVVLHGERLAAPALYDMNIAHEVVAEDQVLARATELATEMAGFPEGATRVMKTATLRVAGAINAATDDPGAWFEQVAQLGARPDGTTGTPQRM